MNPQPKIKPVKKPMYLAFIRRQPCCLTGVTEGIDAHHQAKGGHGTMGGKCCDSRAVPINWKVHNKMESPGNSRRETWEKYGKDPDKVVEEMRSRWIAEGNKEFWVN